VYRNSNLKECIIRISKNGTINIISAQFNDSNLPNKIIDLINDIPECINLEEYQKYYPGKNKLYIIPEITYKYLIQAQFYLIPYDLKKMIDINLNTIYQFIKDNLIDQVTHLDFNNGDRTSKSGKQTNPILQFNYQINNFNVSVAIYKKGAVQLRGSYINKVNNENLDISILEQVYNFILSFIKKIAIYVPDYSYKEKDINEFNTIDSGKPKECRIQDRPVPYAFNGKCKKGYYVAPWGKKRRADGLYEPCCYKITKTGESSLEAINNTVLNGFPNEEQASKYEIDNPDVKSAVYYPGTTVKYQRRFKGLNDLSTKQLIDLSINKNNNSFGFYSKIQINDLQKMYNYLKSI
jgi:hypothetical protein